jgi:hypothetical protein
VLCARSAQTTPDALTRSAWRRWRRARSAALLCGVRRQLALSTPAFAQRGGVVRFWARSEAREQRCSAPASWPGVFDGGMHDVMPAAASCAALRACPALLERCQRAATRAAQHERSNAGGCCVRRRSLAGGVLRPARSHCVALSQRRPVSHRRRPRGCAFFGWHTLPRE